ncbi:multiprotein-bridging factor 1 [Nowakowskiella sp. JEL0078]|nr:multiprotein-bridging factor 1 [Nowakowskiella sp. JEL0078]
MKDKAAVTSAQQRGVALSVEKKTVANKTGSLTIDASKAAKVDRETEDFTVAKVDKSVAQAIREARNKLGLTQTQLAQKINEKATVINEYEAGKATNPNQQILSRLERALNVKLRGQGIGQPFR